MADLLHNQFPPDSLEAKDLEHLLHPTTNLKQHHEVGPVVHERALGVYLWDNQGKKYISGLRDWQAAARKALKSCSPTNTCAAWCIVSASSGWGCQVMPVKIIDFTGNGTVTWFADGVVFATDFRIAEQSRSRYSKRHRK